MEKINRIALILTDVTVGMCLTFKGNDPFCITIFGINWKSV